MLYRNGAQMARGKLKNGPSVAARQFFEVLWRWSKVGFGNSQTRHCANTLHRNELPTQRPCLPKAKSHFRIPSIPSTDYQRRSRSFVPTPSTENATAWSLNTDLKDLETQAPDGSQIPPSEQSPTTPSLDAQSPPTEVAEIVQELELSISHKLRSIMRSLPSSVVVLTTNSTHSTKPDPTTSQPFPFKANPRTLRGITLSSFASVALSPAPVVTFNIRFPSSTLKAISNSKQFLIHILDASPEGARIADAFTKGNGKGERSTLGQAFEQGVADGIFVVKTEWVTGGTGNEDKHIALPRLSGSGVGKVLICELFKNVQPGESMTVKDSYGQLKPSRGLIAVGDHVLVLGQVMEILDRDDKDVEGQGEYGLSYVDGKYRRVGKSISSKDKCVQEKVEGGENP